MSLAGKVAIVTGASRGVGKGIALQLGEAGATVYITGRTVRPSGTAAGPGSLDETAEEVKKRGGNCIPVACDHTKEDDINALFDRVNREQGKLDILVNNAFSAVHALMDVKGRPFWQVPANIFDDVCNVGLRNHYFCAVRAAQMMTDKKQGLIINVSSLGGKMYLFTPVYGVGKVGKDRMAHDCAIELKKFNVAFVSLWPGPVKTEIVEERVIKPMEERKQAGEDTRSAKRRAMDAIFEGGETTEFSGKCVVGLASDANIMQKTGKIVTTGDLAAEYNLIDIDGRRHLSPRSIKYLLSRAGFTGTAGWIPEFVRIPEFLANAYLANK